MNPGFFLKVAYGLLALLVLSGSVTLFGPEAEVAIPFSEESPPAPKAWRMGIDPNAPPFVRNSAAITP
ncbi:MAG: hypothetical protein HQL56_09255 [Magnetococcales bacterium]|nr:hypothetical protein [Magnetococcales bacterium]